MLRPPGEPGRGAMRRSARLCMVGLAIVIATGCVSQRRYEAVAERLAALRKDLNIAKAEELAFAQEVAALSSSKQEGHTDAMATEVAVQWAKEEAKAERRTAEAQLITLQRAVSHLNTQLLTLRDKLGEAKSDTVALSEVVATYRSRVQQEQMTDSSFLPPNATAEPAPEDISLAASLASGSMPDESRPQPLEPLRMPLEEESSQDAFPSPPSGNGLFPSFTDWLASLWQSFISLWQWIFS